MIKNSISHPSNVQTNAVFSIPIRILNINILKRDLSGHTNWTATKDSLNTLKMTFSMMQQISQNQRKQRERYTRLLRPVCPNAKPLCCTIFC